MLLEGKNDPDGMYSGEGDFDLQLQNESITMTRQFNYLRDLFLTKKKT